MEQVNVQHYAVTLPNSKRMIAIVDEPLYVEFNTNHIDYEYHLIDSVGSATYPTREGSITAITVYRTNKPMMKDCLVMITSKPSHISLGEAYSLIEKF